MRRAPDPRRRRRAGIALIAVLAQLTLLFMAWSLANRQSAATIGLEEALGRRAARQWGSLSALASGLALLETGVPDEAKLDADATYGCFVLVPVPDRGSVDLVLARYSLFFTRLPGDPDPGPDPGPEDDPGSGPGPGPDAGPGPSLWNLVVAPYDPVAHIHLEGPITTFAPAEDDDPE